jgi:hypothetical protein
MVSNETVRLCAAAVAAAAGLGLVLCSLPARAQSAGQPVYRIAPFSPADRRQFTPEQRALLEKLNRRDAEHLARLSEVIVPETWTGDELDYSPLPREWRGAAQFAKAIVVDGRSQVFGAYEAGHLVRWGPVSTGRVQSQTPPGFYHLTWRARQRRSTENDEWLLNWYFNFINERGISFHEFELPGRPASHACVRLLARDAKWLFEWGQQWRLNPDKLHVDEPGTPVLILGVYDFRQPPPWLQLAWWQQPIELPADPLAGR